LFLFNFIIKKSIFENHYKTVEKLIDEKEDLAKENIKLYNEFLQSM